jgi:hypothetical protein
VVIGSFGHNHGDEPAVRPRRRLLVLAFRSSRRPYHICYPTSNANVKNYGSYLRQNNLSGTLRDRYGTHGTRFHDGRLRAFIVKAMITNYVTTMNCAYGTKTRIDH